MLGETGECPTASVARVGSPSAGVHTPFVEGQAMWKRSDRDGGRGGDRERYVGGAQVRVQMLFSGMESICLRWMKVRLIIVLEGELGIAPRNPRLQERRYKKLVVNIETKRWLRHGFWSNKSAILVSLLAYTWLVIFPYLSEPPALPVQIVCVPFLSCPEVCLIS